MELEKKGTAGGRSASERGDEPRSGTLYLLKNTPASDSLQPTNERDPNRSLSFVELEDTDHRFRILLIIFIVQITVSKMVSVFDRCKITTFFSYNPLIYKTLFSVVSLYFPRRW